MKILRASSINRSGFLFLVWSFARLSDIWLPDAAVAEDVVGVEGLDDRLLLLERHERVEFLFG